jgi:senataxin
MNVALTRAKFFLFVIARCESIVVNPYWRDLVDHARDTNAVVSVPMNGNNSSSFPDLVHFKHESSNRQGGTKRKRENDQQKPQGRPKEAD